MKIEASRKRVKITIENQEERRGFMDIIYAYLDSGNPDPDTRADVIAKKILEHLK